MPSAVVMLLGVALSVVIFHGTASAETNTDRVKVGRVIYQDYCAACHGEKGEGAPDWQKRDELGELPPPPHNTDGHTWRHSDVLLYRMVEKGWREPFNKTERLTMPAFGDQLSSAEIHAVIAFLKTFWTPEQKRFQQNENQ